MADRARPSKPVGEQLVPGRGEGTAQTARGAGRLKAKPPADSAERILPAAGRRPEKGGSELTGQATSARLKAKPPVAEATGQTRGGSREDRPDPLPDQVAARPRRSSQGSNAPSYVRFRIRVEDGQMSVVDSHLVESALVMPPTLHGEYAYEVTDGTRLLHADTIHDLGVVRAFSNPNGTLEQQRHHMYLQSTYEFDVRVPAEELTREALPRISVVLHRVKEPAPTRVLRHDEPLGSQFEREFREVMRVTIPYEQLPERLRSRERN